LETQLYCRILFFDLIGAAAVREHHTAVDPARDFHHRPLMVEEEVLETVLILALFGISFLILIRFTNRLKAYQQAVNRAVHDKSKLVSRLTEAFRYIGRVNVEIQEIESVLCGVAFYPQSKKEFRRLVDQTGLKGDDHCRCTLAGCSHDRQCTAARPSASMPSSIPRCAFHRSPWATGRFWTGARVDGLQTIGPRQHNLDLLTVFILPASTISKEKNVLLTAILNQIEMLFILHTAPAASNRCTAAEKA
jgi:hypothetical protein